LDAPRTEPLKRPPADDPAWKRGIALLALVLSGWLWFVGLVDSLSRPSVEDDLSLRQLQLTTLAAEALPPELRPALVGEAPRAALVQALERQMEAAELPPTAAQRLELALLERSGEAGEKRQSQPRQDLMALIETVDAPRRPLLTALIDGGRRSPEEQQSLLQPWNPSPMLRQLSCEQLGGPASACPAATEANRLLLRLLGVNLLPLLLVLAGVALLLRRIWLQLRGRSAGAPPLLGPPLSPVDVTLLIAGGFVLIGEVLMPELLRPPLEALVGGLALTAVQAQGLQVLLLYLGLMAAPLLILAWMLPPFSQRPSGGWLQWHLRPIAPALAQAAASVLMVLPCVALSSWLIGRIWGDPGGSNPLLDLVLTSADPLALACFALTAVVLAPLFEETLFRGVLLPVLGRRVGGGWAVVLSAALFAAAHLSVGEFVPLLVLALGLGLLRWQSGRLLPSVLMHALWNGITFLNLLLLAD
jgi:membrane protease YdiL (CAAX protease family)